MSPRWKNAQRSDVLGADMVGVLWGNGMFTPVSSLTKVHSSKFYDYIKNILKNKCNNVTP